MLIHVMNGPHLRGAERFGVELAQSLSDRGVQQKIILLRGPEKPHLEILDCEVKALDRGMGRFKRWLWLRGQLLEETNSVVLCHGQGPQKTSVLALVGSGSRRPYLAVKQIGMLMHWVHRFQTVRLALNRWLMRRTELCVCLGPRQVEEVIELLHVPSEKTVIIPNGRRMPGIIPRDVVRSDREILMVGALASEKNLGLAFDLLAEVREFGVNCRLTLVGDGPLKRELEERAREEFPEDTVRFLGQVSGVWPHYVRASLLLLCSETEGVPGVVIEATLAGLPTVAWDVGDIGSVLEDGRNGRLVPFGDQSALLEALISLLGNQAALKDLQASAARMAPELSFDRIADAYLDCLPLEIGR